MFGVVEVNENCFATCGMDKYVRLWTLRGKAIVTDILYDIDHDSHDIHYNGTYFCVLHREYNAITVLDTQGRQVRKIVRKEALGKEIGFGWDIHIDKTTHYIYVPCWGDNSGVLCLSVHDEALWFTPLDGVPGGITEKGDVLCVSDYFTGHGVQMVSKTGEYKGKLMDTDVLKDRKPLYICYAADAGKIYFSLFDRIDIICFIKL